MKKSVITLLAVAALGVAAPAFAETFNNPNLPKEDVAVANALFGTEEAKKAEETKKAEEAAAALEAEKKANEKTVMDAVSTPAEEGVKVGDVVVSTKDGSKEILVDKGPAKTSENKPAEMKKEEAKKEAAKPVAKPAPKTVAPAATKTAAKALPKTSAVK